MEWIIRTFGIVNIIGFTLCEIILIIAFVLVIKSEVFEGIRAYYIGLISLYQIGAVVLLIALSKA